jgi:hypothetical protein
MIDPEVLIGKGSGIMISNKHDQDTSSPLFCSAAKQQLALVAVWTWSVQLPSLLSYVLHESLL